MSRRSKKSLSVALFPFLAVLVCTMGSLIFLLLVTSRQIHDRALAQAEAELEAAKPALPLLAVSPPEPMVIPALADAEPQVDPRESARVQHAAALAERERELNELLEEWRHKASELAAQRKDQAKGLAQRRSLQEVAARQIVSLQQELRDQETQLKKLSGELSASPSGDATLKERQQIEQEIAALQKRLRAAQVAEAGGNSKFMVVPFDAQSGTSRRPILIECTADGLRFLPEDVIIRPDDLEGFTARVNPLLAGSNSLVSYWTAWNLQQPQPAREPEPYVLMLVRPSGTVAYYIAMKMLATLKQPHGYELIEEETQLQLPVLDPAAKGACEAAIKRLLAERDQIKKFASGGGGIAGFARGNGSKGDSFRAGGGGTGTGSSSTGRGSSNRFDVTDVTGGEDEVGSRSWERIENFAGRNPRRQTAAAETASSSGSSGSSSRKGVADSSSSNEEGDFAPGGSSAEATGELTRNSSGRPSGQTGSLVGRIAENNVRGTSGSTSEERQVGGTAPRGANGIRGTAGSPSAADSGIESLEVASGSDASPGAAGSTATSGKPLDIGLGSTGSTPIAVEDRRTKNKSLNNKPLEPEQFTRKRWGLSAPDAAIGLEREVSVDVEAQRLVIAGKHAIRVGEGESKRETFERMVTVLDLQARDWGQPPHGFYWTPSLRFVVAEGGSSNYELVKSLAERAGLATSKQFAIDRTVKPSSATDNSAGATGGSIETPVQPSNAGSSKSSPAASRRVPGSPVLPPSPAARGGTP